MVVAGVAGEIPVACHWRSRHCTGRITSSRKVSFRLFSHATRRHLIKALRELRTAEHWVKFVSPVRRAPTGFAARVA
jgi:hypothetical protein